MEQYEHEKWAKVEAQKYVEVYGEVPPHWVVFENAHPLGIKWRMGKGEEFVSVFLIWFENHYKTKEQRLAYFRRYSPPARWLGLVAEMVWDLDPFDESDFNYTPYLRQLEEAGFKNTSKFEEDFYDEKWLSYD